jgi:signal transduction histidine kinase
MNSLRARLLASFCLVIGLSLIAAGFVTVWLLRDQQAANAEARIGRLVEPLSQRLLQLQMAGASPDRVAEEMGSYARFFDIRILLVDRDHHVTLDTNLRNPTVGRQITEPERVVSVGPSESFRSLRTRIDSQDLILFAPAERDTANSPGFPFQLRDVSVVIAVPANTVTAAWARLLPRMTIAGSIALLASVVVAGLLSRRITRPLLQMTAASRAMAQGDFSQRIDVHGDDEVAVLGQAFNEMAQQVDRSRSAMRQLVADVSHDLKTPLTSIQGYSQAMLDGVLEDDQERQRAAEVVHEEAERMRALVEDLLYLSQIEAGQLPLSIERLDLDGAVAATAQRFRLQADAAEVTLRVATDGAPVLADERRIEQILANLVENAIRFAPAGSEVLLRTARIPGFTLVEVHNGGDAIPADDLPHLFDRFYQVDRARTRSGEQVHSGLGLSIVRELVHAQGGEVTVQSSRDGGTVFSVTLPVAPAERPGSVAPPDSSGKASSHARATT